MACNLLTRLFRRRTWQSPVPISTEPPVPPALLTHSDSFRLEQSLQQLDLEDKPATEDALLLGYLYEQGSYVLSLLDIPFGTKNESLQSLTEFPGFVGFEGGSSEGRAVAFDISVHFSTAAEAAFAMASQPSITLDNGNVRRISLSDILNEPSERATKRQKMEPREDLPKCLSCCEELPGPHVRPCLHCNLRWCYSCFEANVSFALEDHERFPIKCCGRVVHIDVSKGLIPDDKHAKYKTRFEENSTTKPVYCANVACSEFLPPRISKPDKRGIVRCYTCEQFTCRHCKIPVPAEDNQTHKCTVADEMTALMKQFDYKRCPRCDAGVAKMYGCSHVRCQCGAHWCWDCQRAIQICWSKPCARARDEGDVTDEYYEQEEDSDSEEESMIAAPSESTAPQVITVDGVVVNMDGASAAQTETADGSNTQLQIDPVVQQVEVESQSLEEAIGPVSQPFSVGHVVDPMAAVNESFDETIQSGVAPSVPHGSTGPDAVTLDTPVNNDVPVVEATIPVYNPPAALASTPIATATESSAPEILESLINLDAEDRGDWSHPDYDFGDEPVDESHDTWGCFHHFSPIHSSSMHEYWLPKRPDPVTDRMVKQIDCLRCYKTVTIPGNIPSLEKEEDDVKADKERRDSGVDVDVRRPQGSDEPLSTDSTTTIATIVETDHKGKKKRKVKKNANAPRIFNCARCGVVYCITCKKAVVKELNEIMNKTVY